MAAVFSGSCTRTYDYLSFWHKFTQATPPPPETCTYYFQIANFVHTFYTKQETIILILLETNLYLNLLIHMTFFLIIIFGLHFQDDV